MNHVQVPSYMMDAPKFNEYELREAKNFVLLDSKDEFSSAFDFFVIFFRLELIGSFAFRI